jgi:hypothetical protein
MVVVLLIAGIGLLLAGLLTVAFGIELDLSFGNTLILTGAIAACTGLMMISFWMVVRELKAIARRLGPAIPLETHQGNQRASSGPAAVSANQEEQDGREEPAGADSLASPSWHEQAPIRDREPPASPRPVEPAVKPRRGLFSSASRKERQRAQARAELSDDDMYPAPFVPPPEPEPAEVPQTMLDDGWPKPERGRPADAGQMRRGGRAPAIMNDQYPGAPALDRLSPEITVIKSGSVDGMAYSLYSDGSIEAQMPEGMMRFVSIDELRAHLDQRL